MHDGVFPYISNDPLVLIKLINPFSGSEKEVLAYVDTGSDSLAIPRDVWDELNIKIHLGTVHKNIIVFYQDVGDVLLGRSVIDNYAITFDGLNSTLNVRKT